MEWIVLILFVAAGVQMYRLKKNPELKAKYDKENKETIESLKSAFKPSKKEKTISTPGEAKTTILNKLKKEFEIKSDNNSLVKFKVILDTDDIKSFIDEDKKFGIDTNSKEYYNNFIKNIDNYIYEVEIDRIEDFINNKSFKQVEKYGSLSGFGSDFYDLYYEFSNNDYNDEFEFEDGLIKELSILGCTSEITATDEMKRYYISNKYTVDNLKKLLSSKGFKATGKKEVLVNEVFNNNLISIPKTVQIEKDKFLNVLNEIIKIYATDLNYQLKQNNKAIQNIVIDWALSENSEFKNEIKEFLK